MNNLKKYTRSPCRPTAIKKGRSQDLLRRRDEKLATRFYFYAHCCNRGYQEIIEQLLEEFDLSEKAIVARLRANQQLLDELFNNPPKPADLRKRYPYFSF